MKIKKITDEGIIFNNGYKLEHYHDQDCCEHVYADWEILKTYNVSLKTGEKINIKNIDFKQTIKTLINPVPNAGFNLVSKEGEKFFVPCYNEQNGYYSSNLTLILTSVSELNISDCVEDRID